MSRSRWPDSTNSPSEIPGTDSSSLVRIVASWIQRMPAAVAAGCREHKP